MVNLVALQGRITRDLELKHSGVVNRKYCNNSIAIDRGKDKAGNKRDAVFINFTVWENNAEYLVKYAKKGGQVIIEGRLEQRKEFNYEKNINEYELYVVPTNITIIDFKERQETSALTGELPNQDVNPENSKNPFEEFGEMSYNTEIQNQFEINDDDLPW